MATTTNKTTKPTVASNAKEIKDLKKKISALESKVAKLEEICAELASSKSSSNGVSGDYITRKDWNKLKKALRSVKHPSRAANLI